VRQVKLPLSESNVNMGHSGTGRFSTKRAFVHFKGTRYTSFIHSVDLFIHLDDLFIHLVDLSINLDDLFIHLLIYSYI